MRRRRGSGTIERTKDGRHRARFSLPGCQRTDIEGSPFETRDDAERALAAHLAELKAAGETRGLTFARAAKRALELREKSGYRSVDSEHAIWNSYFEGAQLAKRPIARITRGEVRDLLANLKHQKSGEPLATSTKKNVMNFVRMVLDVAIDDRKLETNVLRGMRVKDAGSVDGEAMYPLALDVARALVKAATDPVVPIAIGTGMRSGELRSLHWQDVHLEEPSPHVIARYGKPRQPRKNGRPLRVPLFGMALAAFRSMPARSSGIVFPTVRGEYRPRGRVVPLEDWKVWLKAAGIARRVRFHDLRHTCATLLLSGALGIAWSYEEVKELLGHSSVKVTERYARVLGARSEMAAEAMRRQEP